MRTYKYRIYPKPSVIAALWRHSSLLNQLYNRFLDEKITLYKEQQKSVSCYEQIKQIPSIKEEIPELKEVYSQIVQQVGIRLDKTYQMFFRRGFGFPKFRSNRNFHAQVYTQSGYKLYDKSVWFSKYGNIPVHYHTPYQGEVQNITLKCEGNKCYLCITTDYNPRFKPDEKSIIGIDLGITNIVAKSDGTIIKNSKHQKYFDKQIAKLQTNRDAHHKYRKDEKASNRRRYLNKRIAQLYSRKNRITRDFVHKVTTTLARQHDTVVIEDLQVNKLGRSKISGLNRELHNSNVGLIIGMLAYKTNHLIKVNPQHTSMTCSYCGFRTDHMSLSNRTFKCPICGLVLDRDINAAKNILHLGKYLLCGNPKTNHHISMAPGHVWEDMQIPSHCPERAIA